MTDAQPSGAPLFDTISSILADLPPSQNAHPSTHNADPSGIYGSVSCPNAMIKNLFAEHRRKAWDKSTEARCNFDYRPRISPRGGVWFLSLWQKSLMGRTLSEIKSDPAEIPHFSDAVSDFLIKMMGASLSNGTWCICTTPKRRHKEHNFASIISEKIAETLGIPFYEDVALCRNRGRINAIFDLNILPDEPNVIVFDDFVTTGSTLGAMSRLLLPLGKTLLFIAGINNA